MLAITANPHRIKAAHRRRRRGASRVRFPGQYFDAETGLAYNYFRDYEPGTGRYVESDPIGLDGGANTYSYVGASPMRFRDSQGLCKVEARCNRLRGGPILGINFSHCYLVVTEPGGGSISYSGEPTTADGSGAASGKSAGGIGVTGDSGWGNITTDKNPYAPGYLEWPTDRNPSTGNRTYIDNNKPCRCINSQLSSIMNGIARAGVPYNPFSTNSNAVAFRGLQSLGISPGMAPAPAVGWGIPLPVDNPGAGDQCCDQ